MAPTVRRQLNVPTQSDADAKFMKRSEKLLQEQIASLLRQRNLFFIRSRMDKKTSVQKGMPDFVIAIPAQGSLARMLLVEVKVKGGKVSDDQLALHREYHEKTDDNVVVVWSLQEFKDILNIITNS